MRQLASIVTGAALFLWPAALNHYPIVFSDTGGLLDMGMLPSMGWDKPFVYGPLIAATSLRLTLWLPAIAQALLLSYVLWLAQRAHAAVAPTRHLACCAILAAITGAPWFAATLMPDAFTPVAALALIASTGDLPRPHRRAAMPIAAIAIAAHLSHLIMAAAIIAALALLRPRQAWRPLASLVAALLFLLASNGLGHGRLAVSPYGSVFALARLIGDGPARDYLDRSCPQAGWRLCAWRSQLTDDSDQFLWDANSPFWADPLPLPEFAAQASQIVRGTVAAYPARVLRDAYRNAAHQLVRIELGDTLRPDYIDATVRPRIQRFLSSTELERYDRGRQRSGALAPLAEPLGPLQRVALLASLLAAATILITGFRRPRPRADFAALMLIALAANALATGALSTVHDRYQARIAWILLLPALVRFAPARYASTVATASGDIRTS